MLEILGVLFCIGLVMALAQPEIFQTAEKNRVRYAGELFQADLDRIRAQAKAGTPVRLQVTANGYRFWLGDAAVVRDYREQGLTFQAAGADETETPGGTEAGAELEFIPDSGGPSAVIRWGNGRYQGIMTLQGDGASGWRYDER
jgi:hypothetical protein